MQMRDLRETMAFNFSEIYVLIALIKVPIITDLPVRSGASLERFLFFFFWVSQDSTTGDGKPPRYFSVL